MIVNWRNFLRGAAAFIAGLAATGVHAHTGHGVAGLFEGLQHPLGLDHLLAAVALGVWSARALPAGRAWQGPAVFLLALVAAALAANAGLGFAWVEQGIALSVVLFGSMLVLAFRTAAPQPGRGLVLVGVAAALHGLAHGSEVGGAAFLPYVMGFVVSTAVLHATGLVAGFGLQRLCASVAQRLAWGVGAGLGAAGLVLLGG